MNSGVKDYLKKNNVVFSEFEEGLKMIVLGLNSDKVQNKCYYNNNNIIVKKISKKEVEITLLRLELDKEMEYISVRLGRHFELWVDKLRLQLK